MRLVTIIFIVALSPANMSSLAAYPFLGEAEDVELQSWMSFEDSEMLSAGLQFVEITTPQLRSADSLKHKDHLSRELSKMMESLQDIADDLFYLDEQDSTHLKKYCTTIERAFDRKVNCACRFQTLILGLESRCWSYERVDLHGFSGRPKYQLLLDLNIFKQNFEVKAKVCLDQTKHEGEDKETLCVAGVFCLGTSTDKTGLCGCLAKYGPIKCSCQACPNGITINCGFYVLQNICVPLPFIVGS